MNCSECVLFKYACKIDKSMTIRRQDKHDSPLKFVVDSPKVGFFSDDTYKSLTVEIFERFIETKGDVVFTKNCVQADRAKGIVEDRKARESCDSTFRNDLKGAKVIVACGNVALEALGYKGRKYSNCTGWVDYNEELGATVLACKDPHEVEESPDKSWKDFVWTLQRAEKILNGEVPDRNILPPIDWKVPESLSELETILNAIPDGAYVECDIETGGLDFLDPDQAILMKGFHHFETCGPVIVPPSVMEDPLYAEVCNAFFKRVKAVLHNSKFDTKFMEHKCGISTPVGLDTIFLHQMIDERTGIHGLNRLVMVYLNWTEYWKELEPFVTNKSLGYREVPFDKLAKYLAYDLYGTYLLRVLFLSMLRDDTERTDLPWPVMITQEEHVEGILVPVNNELRTIERLGTEIDVARLQKLTDVLGPKVAAKKEELELELLDLTGEEFSVDSPKQLLDALHKAEILPTSVDSVDKNILKDFSKHPFVNELLFYSKDKTILNNFYNKSLEKCVQMPDGSVRLFPTFSLVGTIGSRWSSSKPNFQQVPRKGDYKEVFIPSPGRVIFQIDYSGLEARVAAWLSGDKVLAQACRDNLHKTVAEKAFANFFAELSVITTHEALLDWIVSYPMLISVKDSVEKKSFEEGVGVVKEHLRSCAKAITFGIFFGRSPRALAERELMCSIGEAEHFVNEYFRLFPKLAQFISRVKKLVRDEGIITGPSGRRRDLRGWMFSPSLNSRKKALARAERQAVNNLTQGTAGDINNIFFFKACQYLAATGVGRVKGAVHDSVIGEIDLNEETRYHLSQLKKLGEEAFVVDMITFEQEVEVGWSWGEVQAEAKFFDLTKGYITPDFKRGLK